jgi:hypothetical protein
MWSSNALAELLAGKTPEAMYDVLCAGRYLSARGQESPHEELALIKTLVRSSRQRALVPATLLQRLCVALVSSGFLNEAGENLASRNVADGAGG